MALGIQNAMRTFRIVKCSLAHCTIFLHILVNDMIFCTILETFEIIYRARLYF